MAGDHGHRHHHHDHGPPGRVRQLIGAHSHDAADRVDRQMERAATR
jgi:hypothetical protein